MEVLIFLGTLTGICFLAYLLGLRDQNRLDRLLDNKLKADFGEAPNREYKADDLDHLQGFYLKHRDEFGVVKELRGKGTN